MKKFNVLLNALFLVSVIDALNAIIDIRDNATTPYKNTFVTICNLNGQQLLRQQITEPKIVWMNRD